MSFAPAHSYPLRCQLSLKDRELLEVSGWLLETASVKSFGLTRYSRVRLLHAIGLGWDYISEEGEWLERSGVESGG